MILDAAVQLRQLVRDRGPTPAAARQFAKLLLHSTDRPSPGRRVEGIRRPAAFDFSMAVPFGFATGKAQSGFRVAAVCHLFHADMADEFVSAFARIPGRLDVRLTTDTDAKRADIAAAFRGWGKGELEIRIVPNRGRDIGPKLTACAGTYARHDLVLFLHSKRDSHFVDGTGWRRYLLHTLAGTPAIVGSIFEAFRSDPHLGIVMAQHWAPLRGRLDWGDDFLMARDLARRMGIRLTPGHVLDFPSGSMFWARPAALRPLLELGLRPQDFPEESGQLDGTPAHAIERLFLFVCEAAGFRWAKICDPAEAAHKQATVAIDTPEALAAFPRRHGFRLTALAPA